MNICDLPKLNIRNIIAMQLTHFVGFVLVLQEKVLFLWKRRSAHPSSSSSLKRCCGNGHRGRRAGVFARLLVVVACVTTGVNVDRGISSRQGSRDSRAACKVVAVFI